MTLTTVRTASGERAVGSLDYAVLVPRPGKIVCVGLNHRNHDLEIGRDPDELAGGVRPSLAITATVDGEAMQQSDTGELEADPIAPVPYLSTIVTLRPGDGPTLTTEVAGIGRLVNTVRAS